MPLLVGGVREILGSPLLVGEGSRSPPLTGEARDALGLMPLVGEAREGL